MKEYKVKIGTHIVKEKEENLPPRPFVIRSKDGGNLYLITDVENKEDELFYLVSFKDGVAYNRNYTKNFILERLREGVWNLVKCTMNTEE